MTARKGRRLVLWTVASGVLVLIATGVVLKDRLLEQYLIWKLSSGEEEEQWRVAETLRQMGSEAAEEWYVGKLRSGDEEAWSAAAEKLAEMRSSKAVPSILALIDLPFPGSGTPAGGQPYPHGYSLDGVSADTAALVALIESRAGGRIWKPDRAAGSLLVTGSPATHVRMTALLRRIHRIRSVIQRIGDQALPELNRVFKEENTTSAVRHLAAVEFHALIETMEDEREVSRLIEIVEDDIIAPRLKEPAIASLGRIGLDVEKFVPVLTRFLKDPHPDTRSCAADALADIGAPARVAVPVLRSLSADEVHYVRNAAAAALERIQADTSSAGSAESPIGALIAASRNPDARVRKAAVMALEATHLGSRAVVAALGKARDDEDEEVREAAVRALKTIEGERRGQFLTPRRPPRSKEIAP